jgi:hypothetical protein
MIATALSRHAKAVTQRMNGGRLDVPTLAQVRELLENVAIAWAAEVREYPKVAAPVHTIAPVPKGRGDAVETADPATGISRQRDRLHGGWRTRAARV